MAQTGEGPMDPNGCAPETRLMRQINYSKLETQIQRCSYPNGKHVSSSEHQTSTFAHIFWQSSKRFYGQIDILLALKSIHRKQQLFLVCNCVHAFVFGG